MRVLGIDAGLTFGFGIVGHGFRTVSGSHRVKGDSTQLGTAGNDFKRILRVLINAHKPDVVAFAKPFIGSTNARPVFIKGKQVWIKSNPIPPHAIRGLMSFCTLVEMTAADLNMECYEVSEPDARKAFLGKTPRKSADIKLAVMAACRLRGWQVKDNHAADALCVASFVLDSLDLARAHRNTPLFIVREG